MNGLSKSVGTIGGTLSGLAIGGAAGFYAGSRKTKKKAKKTRTKHRKHYKHRKQKKPYTAGKRKDTSKRRIRYTKNNQPYIILSSGKARFIKKSNVTRSRKRKGGKY